MANEFCRALSNKYRFTLLRNNSLTYQPCCWTNNYSVSTKQELDWAQKQITKIAMADTESVCWECLSRERGNYAQSGRLQTQEFVPADAVDGDAHFLEIALDTECNAACVMCGPWYSSLWRKQVGQKVIHINPEPAVKKIPELLDLSKVTRITLLGGEPFFTDVHLQILDYFQHPEKITVGYPTNGSIWPKEQCFTKWREFKKVIINFSIDDMNQRFSYIRWPLKWSRVEDNFRRMVSLVPNSNIEVRMKCTVNPFSIFYLDQLESWVNAVSKELNVPITHTWQAAAGDWGLDCTPESLRQEIYKKYPPGHALISMLDYYVERKDKCQRMVELADDLDKKRKRNWRRTFPEIVKHFDSVSGQEI